MTTTRTDGVTHYTQRLRDANLRHPHSPAAAEVTALAYIGAMAQDHYLSDATILAEVRAIVAAVEIVRQERIGDASAALDAAQREESTQ